MSRLMGIDKSEKHILLKPVSFFLEEPMMRADIMTTKPLPNPIALIVLNKLVMMLYLACGKDLDKATRKENKRQLLLYSGRFADTWRYIPFSGNEQLRKELFGSAIPLPLTIMLQNQYLSSLVPYLSDEGPEQREVREWILLGTHKCCFVSCILLTAFCNPQWNNLESASLLTRATTSSRLSLT